MSSIERTGRHISKRKHNYPAERRGMKTGPKTKFLHGSVLYSVRIPADEMQNKEAKRLITVMLKRFK